VISSGNHNPDEKGAAPAASAVGETGLFKAWPKPKSQRMQAREQSMAATRHTMRLFRAPTPDAADALELAARRQKDATRRKSVDGGELYEDDGEEAAEEEDEESLPFTNPSQNPFNFIKAVQEGTADFLEFVYLKVQLKRPCVPLHLI